MVKSQRRWYNNCIKQQTAKVLTAILIYNGSVSWQTIERMVRL